MCGKEGRKARSKVKSASKIQKDVLERANVKKALVLERKREGRQVWRKGLKKKKMLRF